MALLLPSREIRLPGGYRWAPGAIEPRVWQAHIVKHPLGVYALREISRPWNHEGWDALDPPVVNEAQRARVVAAISELGDKKQRCEVAELRGKRSASRQMECMECEPPLIGSCARVLEADGVGARYAEVAESIVSAAAGGELVPRRALTKVLMKGLTSSALWHGLVVMSVGLTKVGNVARFARADGTLVELYIGPSQLLRWRTAHRTLVVGANERFSFLSKGPAPDPKLSLSDVYVVPRDWWQTHGS